MDNRKYAAVLNRKKIGIDLVAYCNVTIRNQSKKSLDEFEQEIVKYEEVQEVLSLSGTYDFMLKIATKNIDSYNSFITNVLANTPNIYQYHSSIVLNEIKRENAYKLLEDKK
jgi:DNA-binding Lrp family transcriptional regulator